MKMDWIKTAFAKEVQLKILNGLAFKRLALLPEENVVRELQKGRMDETTSES